MDTIVVLDFGSQYNQLIVRRLREQAFYALMMPHDVSYETLSQVEGLKGIVLSGGPKSVYHEDAYTLDDKILEGPWPVLGICYGMQLMVHMSGGEVQAAPRQEFGEALIEVKPDPLFEGTPTPQKVWMSHGDAVVRLSQDYTALAAHELMATLAIKHRSKPFYGVQFHPEVKHSDYGRQILDNFARNICQATPSWTTSHAIETAIGHVQETVKDGHVVLGLSGGVDSSVAAMLLHRAIGKQLTCLFVDHGLLREGEGDQVMKTFEGKYGLNVKRLDVKDRFLKALKGVKEPEAKRKIIGGLFVEVFKETALTLGDVDFLAQGTLYTDIIESGTKTAQTIKSHHNVGGLPEALPFKLIEPLNTLFKDEVRTLGVALGLPHEMVYRQPFPGPGLAIRLMGEVTDSRLETLKKADTILRDIIAQEGLSDDVWQYFTVLLDTKSVGVQGDQRVYDEVMAIRAVESSDGMTADFARLPWEVLAKISRTITNDVRGVSRVVYDITSKPPGTIEWE